jgi:hypothetical protein
VTALPTFFIIGAPKAGTTSLHHYLDQHPRIEMAAVKEPRFFASPGKGVRSPPERISDLAQYERLFDPAVEVRGESSTDYSTYPRWHGAPERIGELVPDAKFIYLVRDPVGRTISHYKMRVASGGEREPLSSALRDFSDLCSPYIWPSLYASQLERYLRCFPQQSVLVVDQADLLAERQQTLREIFAFLAVDELVDSRFDEELLTGHELRAYPSTYAHLVSNVVAPRARWIPRDLRRSARRSVERLLWPPFDLTVDDELRARLEDRYAPEAGRLRALTGKSFPTWSV